MNWAELFNKLGPSCLGPSSMLALNSGRYDGFLFYVII